jgi:hypothetical protein
MTKKKYISLNEYLGQKNEADNITVSIRLVGGAKCIISGTVGAVRGALSHLEVKVRYSEVRRRMRSNIYADERT